MLKKKTCGNCSGSGLIYGGMRCTVCRGKGYFKIKS